jgi:glycosyltransferase involved in cell wall biosynthesis
MRIAILNWSSRRIGGTGTYLSAVMPHLEKAGHDVALWHEVDTPVDYDPIPLPSAAPVWSVAALGLEPALAALASWRPHLLYAHGLLDPAVERRTLDIAPAVFFAHNYYGTCISGAKTFKNPVVTPCDRRFGWQCLAQYYPRRCGGWNPVTMMRLFRQQKDRLELLPRYGAIVTHSTHMQNEYVNHGLNASRVFNVKYASDLAVSQGPGETSGPTHDESDRPWNLLFVGRMDELKGGRELLQSLPDVIRRLGRNVRLTFAGAGPLRVTWEALAAEVSRSEPRLQVEFTGWVDRAAIDELFAHSDLLVLPSLWPEPLALVGLEAARHRVPVAAFGVGGIGEWLTSGHNGFLAPGNPPTVGGLTDAIVACLRDPQTHARLKQGASGLSADFAFDTHVELLLRAFTDVAHAA